MSNGTGKPKRAMQLVGALIAVAGLLVTLTTLASAQNAATQGPYSGSIASPDSCLTMSLGGPVLVPSDTNNDGVYDTCVQPYSLREATARQNAKEAFSNLLTDYFGQIFAQECVLVASTFGQPADEATDECASPRASYAQGTLLASLPAVPPTAAPQSSTLCSSQSRGGQTTYPTDTDNNGFADACTLPRTMRAAVARQNALNRLSTEYPVAYNTMLQQQCQSLPATFGEPSKEATDVCSPYYEPSPTGTPLPTRTPTVTPSPTPGTSPGTPSTPSTPSRNSPTATSPSAYNARAAQNVRLEPGDRQITVAWDEVRGDDDQTDSDTDPYDKNQVFEYEVWWTPRGSSWSSTNMMYFNNTNNSSVFTGKKYTITGLTNDTTYDVRVKAVRGQSSSDYFTPTVSITPGLPGPPTWPNDTNFGTNKVGIGKKYAACQWPKWDCINAQTHLENTDYGELTVKWRPPWTSTTTAQLPVEHYFLEWSTSSSFSNSGQTTVAKTTTPYVITGLIYNRTYYVRVQAVADSGPGTWSVTKKLTLSSNLETPGQPDDLTLTSASGTSLKANWTRPEVTTKDPIPTHYIIQWRNRTKNENWSPSRQTKLTPSQSACSSSDTACQYTITGLTGRNKYDVRVQAINRLVAGSWEYSSQLLLGDSAIPRSIKMVPGNRAITVNWSAPPSKPDATNYILQWGTCSGCFSNTRQITTSSTSHTLTNLNNGTTYYARLKSINDYGPGTSWSSTVSMAAGAPIAPTSGSAAAIANDFTSLTVSWNYTQEDTKPNVSGFRIYYAILTASGDGSNKHLTLTSEGLTIDGNRYSYKLTGLKTNTYYAIQVRAKNSYGSGTWSPIIFSELTTNGYLGAPTIAPTTAPNAVTAVVSADTSDTTKPKPTQFQLGYRLCTNSNNTCKTTDSWSTTTLYPPTGNSDTTKNCLKTQLGKCTATKTYSNLQGGKTYEFRARSYNSFGWGEWSSPTSATPPSS